MQIVDVLLAKMKPSSEKSGISGEIPVLFKLGFAFLYKYGIIYRDGGFPPISHHSLLVIVKDY